MINLELTQDSRVRRPGSRSGPTGCRRTRRGYAIAALVLWSLAMVAGRFTAYPNFVEAWIGF